jgi:hypothetical protein
MDKKKSFQDILQISVDAIIENNPLKIKKELDEIDDGIKEYQQEISTLEEKIRQKTIVAKEQDLLQWDMTELSKLKKESIALKYALASSMKPAEPSEEDKASIEAFLSTELKFQSVDSDVTHNGAFWDLSIHYNANKVNAKRLIKQEECRYARMFSEFAGVIFTLADCANRSNEESMKITSGSITVITKTKDFENVPLYDYIPIEVLVDKALTGLDINPNNLGIKGKKYVSIDNALRDNSVGIFLECFSTFVQHNVDSKDCLHLGRIRLDMDVFFQTMQTRIPILKQAQKEAFRTQEILLEKQIKKIRASKVLTDNAKDIMICDLRLQLKRAQLQHETNLEQFEQLARNSEAIEQFKEYSEKINNIKTPPDYLKQLGKLSAECAGKVREILKKAERIEIHSAPEKTGLSKDLEDALLGAYIERTDGIDEKDRENLKLISLYSHLIRENFMTKANVALKLAISTIDMKQNIESRDIAEKLENLKRLAREHVNQRKIEVSGTVAKKEKLLQIEQRLDELAILETSTTMSVDPSELQSPSQDKEQKQNTTEESKQNKLNFLKRALKAFCAFMKKSLEKIKQAISRSKDNKK